MISDNELKRLKRLKQKKYRLQEKRFLVEGVRLVQEALYAGATEAIFFLSEKRPQDHIAALLNAAEKANISIKELNQRSLKDLTDTVAQQGVVAVARIPDNLELTTLKGNWLYLDQIRDPGNLGTILRTADWFGVTNVALSPGTADPYNSKVVRGAMGAHFHLKIRTETTLPPFGSAGYTVLAADSLGEPMKKIEQLDGKWCLVMGSEASGIAEENRPHINHFVSIPGAGGAESLNVAVAAGIFLNQLTGR
tara:strand:- start:41306 stop:42058 length:753 start_codon:yes stop_codon:yes gene_type:complete